MRLLVQSSPLAGFRYHAAAEVWQELRVGDALELRARAGQSARRERGERVAGAAASSATCRGARTPRSRGASIAAQPLRARISRLARASEPGAAHRVRGVRGVRVESRHEIRAARDDQSALAARVAAHFAESAKLKLEAAQALNGADRARRRADRASRCGRAARCSPAATAARPPTRSTSPPSWSTASRCERPPLAGDRAHHRHLDSDLDRQRLRLPAGVLQAGAGARPARRRAARDLDQRQLGQRDRGDHAPRTSSACASSPSPATAAARWRRCSAPTTCTSACRTRSPRASRKSTCSRCTACATASTSSCSAPSRDEALACAARAAAGAVAARGCAPVLIGAGAAGALSMSEDRRSSGAQLDDQSIEWRASSRIGERFGAQGARQRHLLQPHGAAHRRGARRAHARRGRQAGARACRACAGVDQRAGGGGADLARQPHHRLLHHLEDQDALPRRGQVQRDARQGGHRGRRGLPARHGDREGGRRRGGDRAHHRRRAQGGEDVRVLQADRRGLPADAAAAAAEAGRPVR